MNENKNTDPDMTAKMPKAGEEQDQAVRAACASIEKAKKRIERALEKSGTECAPETLESTLETLYAAYETVGTVPTREAFAECCPNHVAGQVVCDMEKDPFAPVNKKKAAIIAAIAAVALIAGGAAIWATSQPSTEPAQVPEQTVSSASDAVEPVESTVNVTIKADGASADSTTVQIEVLDNTGAAVASGMDIPANQTFELGKFPAGEYSLHVVQAPVNTDGSTYKLPEQPTAFTVGEDGTDVSVEVGLEKLETADMSKEQLEAAAQALENSGKGEQAKEVENKATTAPSRPGSAEQVKTEPSQPASSNNSEVHTHNWVPITKTVHHDAEYKTVHHDAQYKTVHHDAVTKSATICNQCGADITGNVTEHFMNALENGTACAKAGYHNETIVVKAAYDEKVLVKEAYDEKVLVHAAWDETVTTGYKCSGCGATK